MWKRSGRAALPTYVQDMKYTARRRPNPFPITTTDPSFVVGARVDMQAFITRCFAWMFVGLMLTAGVAAWMSSIDITGYLQNHGIVLIAAIVAEFVCVIAIAGGIDRMSSQVAATIFCLYAGINGVIFTVILDQYSAGAVVAAAATAAAMFGGMCLYGYVTKRDLDSIGSFCFMGLIGLIVAMIVNIFLASSALFWAISVAGVLVFLGLTAYDMQKIKDFGSGPAGEDADKGAVYGALILYLDFINLFLFLLRIFGGAGSGKN